ncbi:hypothetical protein jhhlp_005750 [Lomentospora prolificans]|uniref:Uncharacterized protein n=1 Tax=Lomentospora prolificans TaxID=41688 RepID=A0A2N3N3Y9_9PEZI|nr:hypothetical protein jhhlp_005750 [Lomentospora prolificans]
MRLIDTSTLKLQFFASDVPPYAILSHTWGDGEVAFQDMQRGRAFASRLQGFAKIEDCCRQAKRDGYAWAWVDTCCIDKQSSAELSEAINSMYRWYQHSAVCYVYMPDVVADPDSFPVSNSPTSLVPGEAWPSSPGRDAKHLRRLGLAFAASRWFRRGWTLQELIAPRLVEFYDRDWTEIGTKASLVSDLQRITGIRAEILQGASPGSLCTIAERLSWASKRDTLRVEDRAYSLLGIFNVNMPLLYGEGQNAFIRLQEEIIRRSEDLSLLAWYQPRLPGSYSGVLAPDPAGFTPVLFTENAPVMQSDSAGGPVLGLTWKDVQTVTPDLITDPRARCHLPLPLGSGNETVPPPTVTSRGIRVTLPVVEPSKLGITSHPNDLMVWPFLGARRGASPDEGVWLCIIVRVVSAVGRPGGHVQGDDYLVASRPTPGTARGLICMSPRDIKHFKWKRLYLAYNSTPTTPRTEWSVNYPNDGYPSHQESLTSNVLIVRLGGVNSHLSVDAHRPSEWKMAEMTKGTYHMYIPVPDPHNRSPDESKQTSVQEAQFLCSYYGSTTLNRSSAHERFLVVFSTYYQGLSRRFSCRVRKISGNPRADIPREPSYATSQREGSLVPVDRAYLLFESGVVLQVAIKENVHLIRDNCQFVGVALTMTINMQGMRRSPRS